MNILKIESSARINGSVSRQLSNQLVDELAEQNPAANIIERDVSAGLPVINENWVNANFTPADQRSEAQKETLALSDQLVEEIKTADIVVIAAPMYNFGIPATLKAYIDLICRAGLTFKYTENGPVGLLQGKQAFIVTATGGTPIGSSIDFLSGYLKQVLGFIGISDASLISADRLNAHQNQAIEAAKTEITRLLSAEAA